MNLLVEAGVRQFLDIGAGLPTQENVHQVALRAAPDSRVVYVDNDPIVLTHGRALLADNGQTIVVDGDLRNPEAILDDPRIREHIDFDQPVGLLMLAVLHFIPTDDVAESVTATLRDRLAPGSGIVISHLSFGDLDEDKLSRGPRALHPYVRGLRDASPTGTDPALLRRIRARGARPGAHRGLASRGGPARLPQLPGVNGYSGVGLLR